MRIPFPERVPIARAMVFAVALFCVQRFEGTGLFFSSGCVVFILIAALAFNSGGGLTRVSGAYVFFYALLVVIVGLCYKAFMGEPAESNLLDPRTDIEVYVGGISALFAAVIVSRRISRKTGLLQNIMKERDMYRSSIGCILIGFTGPIILSVLGEGGARLQSAFGQLNQLIGLGIIIGVIYEIRRSGGTRCIDLTMVLAAAYAFVLGILAFSKQGMLTPLFCLFVPIWALRYRLSTLQVVSGLLSLFIIFHFLVPYSQFGRRYIEPKQTLSQKIAIAAPLLEHIDDTRKAYDEEQANSPDRGLAAYYSTPQGFWERLQMISVDDKLANITDQGKVFGLTPVTASFLNAIPHVFWPDKPQLNFGNAYTHEIGGIPDVDTSTGISFSSTAEAYHMARWVGVLVIAPTLWLMLFVIFDSLFGDLRATPWGLLILAYFGHFVPEGALTSVIYTITFGTEIFVFCALFATYVAPVFATAVLGPDRRRVPRPHFLPSAPSSGVPS